jgi:hypothetical protein
MPEYRGAQYTVTASAVALNTALGYTDGTYYQQIKFFADPGNAGPVYLGGSTVTTVPANAFKVIAAGGEHNIGPLAAGPIDASTVYIIGTANDTVYIEAIPF